MKNNNMKDLRDFTEHKNELTGEVTLSTEDAIKFVWKAFPERLQLKIDWLRFEQDIRRALTLDTGYENRLMIIDILLGEHTGRGTELGPRG